MTALARLTLVELKLFVRDPAAAFFTLLLPLILLVLNANPTPAVEERLPGLCVLVLATAGLMWLPEVIASYRERGILRRQRLAPIGPLVIVGAHTGVQVLVAGAGIATWPRDELPPVARAIGDAFPLTYAVEVVRRPWIDGGLPPADTLVLLALIGVAAPAVAATFRWR